MRMCPDCEGEGVVADYDDDDTPWATMICPRCGGKGAVNG